MNANSPRRIEPLEARIAPAFGAVFELSSLNGTNGFKLSGEAVGDYAGGFVSDAGDVNGDGFSDLLIGAQRAEAGGTDRGAAYVIFGKTGGFGANLNLSSLNGSTGFKISGEADGDLAGDSVSGAGDVNNDGFDDLLIAASQADPNGAGSGAAYVVFGKAGGFSANLNLSTLDGLNGFKMSGAAAGDLAGSAVSGAGDVNGDGFADVIVGARYADPNGNASGTAYVVFGKAAGFSANLNLASLDGITGFKLHGQTSDDRAGESLGFAGDVNGDGFADLLIGAGGNGGGDEGAAYVVFGKAGGFLANLNLSTLNGTTGFKLIGANVGDQAGAVNGAGDVNGDGFADLIVGAQKADPNGLSSGASYMVFGKASGFGVSLALSSLNGANGFKISGALAGDSAGQSVSRAGDVNGDGFADLFIGALAAGPNGALSGASYVVFGKAAGFGANLNVSTLDGTNGFKLNGVAAGDGAGAVRGVGDVNGDGIADLLIGARSADANGIDSGASYVVFGQPAVAPTAFGSNINLGAITGTDGFKISGEAVDDGAGLAVSGAGDINGDGIADVIVGAFHAGPSGNSSGASYVVFGSRSGFPPNLNLSTLSVSNGFKISGALIYDNSGRAVSGAGDINGDGIDDLIVGAQFADRNPDDTSGASYVVFGSRSGLANLNLSTLPSSSGFKIVGAAANDRAGVSVSGAGDINGDGIADLIVGAYYADPNGNINSGASYVVFGRRGFAGNLDLLTLASPNGFRISGEVAGDRAGFSVSGAGDINGDGIDDLIVGAHYADPNGSGSGASYVVFGSRSVFASNLNLSALTGGNGFKISGVAANDQSGFPVSGAGDINGDGIADLIVGARFADPNGSYSGASYVVFGSRSVFAPNLNLLTLTGSNGFKISGVAGYDLSGISVSGAGDINGDGIDDLIVGAEGADANGGDSGASYVVFGKRSVFDPNLNLSTLTGPNGFKISGALAGDKSGISVSGAGDVNGDGIADLIVGAPDADPNGNSKSGASYVLFGHRALAPLSALSIGDVTVNEGAGTATFTVTLSAASGQAVSVNYATGGGTATAGADYTGVSGTLNFAAGVLSQTITVPILNDAVFENSESFNVNLSGSVNASIFDNLGLGTIRDDGTGFGGTDNDTPALSMGGVAVTEGADNFAIFALSLSNTSTTPVSFNLALAGVSATGGGADYGTGGAGNLQVSTNAGGPWADAGSATIAAGATSVFARTPVVNDALDENAETFTLTATRTAGVTSNASATGTAAIADDDPTPSLNIDDMTVNEGAGTATFTVTLSGASGQAVSVNYATGNGTATAGADYTGVSGTLNFAAGVVSQTITVPLLNDALNETAETFTLTAMRTAGVTTNASVTGTATIADDDATPTLSIADVTVAEGSAGTTAATFTVTLSNPSSQTVTVQYATADGTAIAPGDYAAVALTTLTFAPGEVSQTIVIAVGGDADVEENETFSLDFRSPTNAALPDPQAQGTIVNDDLVVTPTPGGGSSVKVTDVDGDKVVVSIDQDAFAEDDFVFAPDGTLAMIDLQGNARFSGANVTIRAEKAGGGDGRVEIGALNAAGMDLKNVTVQGSLGKIMVGDGDTSRPALKKLIVDSLGSADAVDQPLISEINGSLGKLMVSGDVNQASFKVNGRLGSVSIGGNLLGQDGGGARLVASLARFGSVAALGGRSGGLPEGIFGESIGTFTIEGNMSSAAVVATGTIDSVEVKGDVAAGAVIAAARIPVVKVLRNLASDDPAKPVIVAVVARGSAIPAIDKLIVRGDVRNAQILLGYKSRLLEINLPEDERTPLPKNADARVGKIKVLGNWSASSLVASVLDATGDGFGQNDTIFAVDRTPDLASRIASIVIKGTATGSAAEGDHFGISAQRIGKLSIGGEDIALKKNQRDNLLLDGKNGDFRLVEIKR